MSGLRPECAPKRTSADHSEVWVHAKLPGGQITSDFQKSCQAPNVLAHQAMQALWVKNSSPVTVVRTIIAYAVS